ncbi:Verru_Chthon cassette protein A [Verrucomicrobium sp. GAS474]|uniref:Verru_Chthon cassette protein A n=1 Tax=Verrucomicrobium sp. GAS474 TaxID=1882831 RepID=UPI0021010E07|nr:Verru_Chthon cassette protein A [Verrucomicrobium sp. GAS474]
MVRRHRLLHRPQRPRPHRRDRPLPDPRRRPREGFDRGLHLPHGRVEHRPRRVQGHRAPRRSRRRHRQPRPVPRPVAPHATDDDSRTPFDRLVANAATVNQVPYYFTRSDWKSPNELDLDQNRSVLGYLRFLCGKSIPGFVGKLSDKYSASNTKGTEIDQILTEIFDYIRCVNLCDTSKGTTGSFKTFTPRPPAAASGQVVPTYDSKTDTKGFGRFPTLAKAGLFFIAAEDPKHLTTAATWAAPATGKIRVQAALVFQLFDPGQGYPGLYTDVNLAVTPNLTWDYGSMFGSGTLNAAGNSGTSAVMRYWGGTLGFRLLRFYPYGGSGSPLVTKLDSTHLTEFPDAANGGVIHFKGGTVKVDLSSNLAGTSTIVQTINLTFPAGDFPVPSLAAEIPTTIPVQTSFQMSGVNYYPNEMSSRLSQSSFGGDPRGDIFTFTQNDVLQTIQSPSGDYRLVAGLQTVSAAEGSQLFVAHPDWGKQAQAHSFKEPDGTDYNGASIGLLAPVSATGYANSSNVANPSSLPPRRYNNTNKPTYSGAKPGWTVSITPDGTPPGLNGSTAGSTASFTTGNPPGDWDNGTGNVPDGAYINRPDEATNDSPSYFPNNVRTNLVDGTRFFSANRLMPSAVMFGSLPTGVIASAVGNAPQPWQTLLFHRDPTGKHKGAQAPMDHLLLDLFTMPVIEPYAITEPLSTDGRVNMNYQILPFTYINRDTGVRAVLKSERMLAVANKYAGLGPGVVDLAVYKQLYTAGAVRKYTVSDFRFDINADETLKGFQARFAANDLFRSASEICALDLVPNDTGAAYGGTTMQTYWENHALTGDNSREKPYADLYPRLTTKSNTFTVHLRVQALKQAAGASADPAKWREGVDTVTAEYRGSRVVERYVDPANKQIPDYTNTAVKTPLSQFYRFRIVEAKSFPQ